MMWIILFTNVILLFRNVILQTKTIILLSTKIISLAKIIQNKISLKSTLHSLTFNFATVLFTNRKSDFLQCSFLLCGFLFILYSFGGNSRIWHGAFSYSMSHVNDSTGHSWGDCVDYNTQNFPLSSSNPREIRIW